MKHQGHSETTTSRAVAKTMGLIADLDHIVQILGEAIAAEEELAGVSDHLQTGYPMNARALAARRDNLLDTIAALKAGL